MASDLFNETSLLTAADAGFFPGLRLLARAAGAFCPEVPLCCVDLGLSGEQRAWLAGQAGANLIAEASDSRAQAPSTPGQSGAEVARRFDLCNACNAAPPRTVAL